MPILELTQLRLKGLPADHPSVLESLSLVRGKLHTNSSFYNCDGEDPTLIYILGSWPSLEAHMDFLASPARDGVLGPQENMLQFCWTVHMKFDGMNSLPLDAPVLAIERLSVRGNCVDAFHQAAVRHMQYLQGSNPFQSAYGWRCDAAPGSHEAIFLSGWDTTQAHVPFAVKQKGYGDNGSAAIGQYEQMLLHHAQNLERKPA